MTRRKNNPYNVQYVMKRDNCTEETAIEIINLLKNKTSGSKKTFIERYGETEGLVRYREFCNKSAHTEETFRKKFGDKWKYEWEKYLKTKDSSSLEFFVKKYGAELGTKKFEEKCNKTIQTLNNFIDRYGENEGKIKYKEYIDKKSFSCSTDGLIKKFGIEKTLKINKSKSNPGEKNGMYGKPSPQGSGNGWSGWYKGIYFRSILELSYMYHLEKNNIEFESAERKQYEVNYKFNGSKRTYRADFIVHDIIIEIKPKNLINTLQNKAKFDAAKEKYGDKFKILTEEDFPKLDDIRKLIKSGDVVLTERYKIKYIERKYNENNKN